MEDDLLLRLSLNVENIAKSLISSIGLKFDAENEKYGDSLFRWLDFRLRFIDPKARGVLYASQFPKDIAGEALVGLRYLEQRIKSGEDINPYQGKGIINFHDTNDNKKKRRTDFLWANWRIHHFHLTANPVQQDNYFSDRSDWLLFCYVDDSVIAMLDIRRHDEQNVFCCPELVERLLNEWPLLADQFEMKGMLPSKERRSPQEIRTLWESGLSTPVEFNGKVYVGPGMGVTTASTSVRASLAASELHALTKQVAEFIRDINGPVQEHIRRKNVANPLFSLALTPKGIAIYEAVSDVAWIQTDTSDQIPQGLLASINHYLAPAWLIESLNAALERAASG